MLHNITFFLPSHCKDNQWHICYSPYNCTPIIDYQYREKEKGRQLTFKRSNHRTYHQTYNQVFIDTHNCIYKSTCFLSSKCTFDCQKLVHWKVSHNPRVNTMALMTSSYESYRDAISDWRIYTEWIFVHSLHPSWPQANAQKSSS